MRVSRGICSVSVPPSVATSVEYREEAQDQPTSCGVTYEIVGVVRDTKYYQRLREATPRTMTMYVAWTQREEADQPASYAYLVRAGEGAPLRLVPELAPLVRAADPQLRVLTAIPYETLIDRSISNERVMATLGGLFGTLGLLIAAVGMFGVLAFQVARRTNELGVRMVLGANRWSVMGLVLRDVVAMLIPGIAIGAGMSLMVTGFARGMLFGLTPTDPAAFVMAASVLTGAALIAGWLPARRASRVELTNALRHEGRPRNGRSVLAWLDLSSRQIPFDLTVVSPLLGTFFRARRSSDPSGRRHRVL